MIQLNLLPDVKLEYIKAQRLRRMVLLISVAVTAVAVGILVLLLIWDFGQKKLISNRSNDIATESRELQQKPDITKILTVQNQLESLTALHSGKPAAARLFGTYLDQVTPGGVSISSFHVDYTASTMTLTGTADALSTVNKYVDTLKFTTYTTDNNKTATKAFTDVVLSSFAVTTGQQDKSQQASYTIGLTYDKTIFDNTQNVTLAVPNLVTTRSQLDQPGDLFKAAPNGSGATSGSTH